MNDERKNMNTKLKTVCRIVSWIIAFGFIAYLSLDWIAYLTIRYELRGLSFGWGTSTNETHAVNN